MGLWEYLSRLWRKEPSRPTAPSPEPAARPAAPPPPPPAPEVAPAPQAPPGPAALQAGDFLPVTRDELMKGGEEVRRTTGWMWFGRRDIIPPASDPRTRLIDRGMLTQGLLTAEELAEMHAVGEQYDRFADRFADREQHIAVKAGQSAEQAVEADRAARAAVKARKKAEAAARKQKRAEEVAARKASDIVFVGKGVSALMNDRRSDAAKLEAAGLPVLHAPADLAAALGLTVPRLRWLCFHAEVATRIHYVPFEVPKKSGGTRTLAAPHRTIDAAQRWVLAHVLGKLSVEEAAHGFVAGRSTLTNARPHARKGLVINLDLEAFFPSIGFPRVRHLFRRLGYSGSVATLLALLCTECPRRKVVYDGTTYFVATGPRGLPQGACTSPATSNQIARRLDRRLSGLARKLGLVYTRYADDLTFSGDATFNEKVGYLMARVRHIAGDEGFAVNPRKTRVKRPHARQTVTGLVVNERPGVPRDVVRRVRAILHAARQGGLEAQNRQGVPNFRAWVEGMIAYVAMSRPEAGAKLRQALNELPP
jgi:retron-type reverse transcriptase